MLCPECKDGFLCEPFPKAFVLSYRGFTREIGTEIYLSCSNCLYVSTEPSMRVSDVDSKLAEFKRGVNRVLSIGDIENE